ncbi:MAG: hypothetical protein JWN37_102 [Candidatus Nomurabacteria bacterium]|nr:hypothetical protein [Candidatus Nomurabacteria bacterium]
MQIHEKIGKLGASVFLMSMIPNTPEGNEAIDTMLAKAGAQMLLWCNALYYPTMEFAEWVHQQETRIEERFKANPALDRMKKEADFLLEAHWDQELEEAREEYANDPEHRAMVARINEKIEERLAADPELRREFEEGLAAHIALVCEQSARKRIH